MDCLFGVGLFPSQGPGNMIANFYYLLMYMVFSLLSDLPAAPPLASPIMDAITWINSCISVFGYFVPFATLFQILGLVFFIEFAIQTFRWTTWIYNKVRGSG